MLATTKIQFNDCPLNVNSDTARSYIIPWYYKMTFITM